MARYNIDQLNYISSGKNRTFINMDVNLDHSDYYDYVHLLAIEDSVGKKIDSRISDIVVETNGTFYNTEYIQADTTVLNSQDTRRSTKINKNILSSKESTNNYLSSYLSSYITSYISALITEDIKDGIILNESQKYWKPSSDDVRTYIRLYLSCDNPTYRQKIMDFYKQKYISNHTYVIEHNQINQTLNTLNSTSSTVLPMYDIDDVYIKSKQPIINNIFKNFDNEKPTKTDDIYIPSGTNIINFCQNGDHTYLLTEPTQTQVESLRIKKDATSYTQQYTIQIESKQNYLNLYKSKSDLSTDTYKNSIISGYLSSNPENFFYDVKTLNGMLYNYIIDTPMKNIIKYYGETDFTNGNIYGDMLNSKSMYDPTYCMNMNNKDSLSNCRDYQELNTCRGDVYAKYNDYVSYDIIGDKSTNFTLKRNESSKYTYPKIEFINKVQTQTQKRHKSFFFSINIDGGIDLEYEQNNIKKSNINIDKIKKEIKDDINTSIREIVRNVCPVQTQLFEIQYSGVS